MPRVKSLELRKIYWVNVCPRFDVVDSESKTRVNEFWNIYLQGLGVLDPYEFTLGSFPG